MADDQAPPQQQQQEGAYTDAEEAGRIVLSQHTSNPESFKTLLPVARKAASNWQMHRKRSRPVRSSARARSNGSTMIRDLASFEALIRTKTRLSTFGTCGPKTLSCQLSILENMFNFLWRQTVQMTAATSASRPLT